MNVEFVSSWLPKNVRVVSFVPGDRGSACIRILSSHKECYFDSSMCFRHQSDDPLFISFDLNNNYDKNKYDSYDKVDTIPYVSTGRTAIDHDFEAPVKGNGWDLMSHIFRQRPEGWRFEKMGEIKNVLKLARKAQPKLLFVATHETSLYFPFEYVHIWVSDRQSRLDRLDREQAKKSPWSFTFHQLDKENNAYKKNQANPHCFCIDSFKLLSLDYETFENEYTRIVDHFNFTNNIDRVRAFVEEYHDRQRKLHDLP